MLPLYHGELKIREMGPGARDQSSGPCDPLGPCCRPTLQFDEKVQFLRRPIKTRSHRHPDSSTAASGVFISEPQRRCCSRVVHVLKAPLVGVDRASCGTRAFRPSPLRGLDLVPPRHRLPVLCVPDELVTSSCVEAAASSWAPMGASLVNSTQSGQERADRPLQ